MNLWVLILIALILVGLRRLRLGTIGWVFIWPIAIWALIHWGISPPVPSSVVNIYIALSVVSVIAYVLADGERSDQVSRQISRFIIDDKFAVSRLVLVVLLPTLLAYKVYSDMNVELRAPNAGRTVHPAPPGQITFKGKQIDLIKGKNPYRELETKEPAKFREHVEEGRKIYYKNCFYCHGDDMGGDGVYAHGFNPVPANFNSATMIAQLQEGYLFWRIAKGGPGLPEASAPWLSSMPAWEKFLSEDDIWNVILYLYDYTGYKPRAEEEGHH